MAGVNTGVLVAARPVGQKTDSSRSRQHSSLLTNQKQVNKTMATGQVPREKYTYHELFQGFLKELVVDAQATGVLDGRKRVFHD